MIGALSRAIRVRQQYLPARVESEQSVRSTKSGTLWTTGGVLVTAGIRIAGTLILARLLSAEEFGIIAIASAAVYLVMVFANMGILTSVIHSTIVTKRDLCTAWWFNLLVDGVAVGVCLATAPVVAAYYEDPRIEALVYATASTIILEALGGVNLALLKKQHMFKAIAMISVVGTAAEVVTSIVLVGLMSMGVNGVALGIVAAGMVGFGLKAVAVPWLPSGEFSMGSLRSLMGYGKWLFAGSLVTYLNQTLDQFLTGKLLGLRELGLYSMANNVMNLLLSRAVYPVNTVSFVALSNVRLDERASRELCSDLTRTMCLMMFPLCIGLAIVCREFVLVMYGNQWAAMIQPMEIVCVGGTIRTIAALLPTMVNALGKPAAWVRANVLCLPPYCIGLYVLGAWYGIEGVAVAMILGSLLNIVLIGRPVMKALGVKPSDMLKPIIPALICTGVMVTCVLPVQYYIRALAGAGPLLTLTVVITVGGASYLGAMTFFYREIIESWMGPLRTEVRKLRIWAAV